MGNTTFASSVRAMGGFNAYGNATVVNETGTTFAPTVSDHGGKLLVLNNATMVVTIPEIVATDPGNDFAPGAPNNLGTTFRFFIQTSATAMEINLSGSDIFIGNVQNATDGDATAAAYTYHAVASDAFVSMDMNGGTSGGREGSWIELTAVASGVWGVKGVINAIGVRINPFTT